MAENIGYSLRNVSDLHVDEIHAYSMQHPDLVEGFISARGVDDSTLGEIFSLSAMDDNQFDNQPFPLASTHFYIRSSRRSVIGSIRLVSEWLESQKVVVSRFQSSTLTWVCSQVSDGGSVRFLVRYFPSYTILDADGLALPAKPSGSKTPPSAASAESINQSSPEADSNSTSPSEEKGTLVELRRLRGNSTIFYLIFRQLRSFLLMRLDDKARMSPASPPEESAFNFVTSPRSAEAMDLLHGEAQRSPIPILVAARQKVSKCYSPKVSDAASIPHVQHYPTHCEEIGLKPTVTRDLPLSTISPIDCFEPEEARRLLGPNVMAAALWSIEQWLSSEDRSISSEALRAMGPTLAQCQHLLNQMLGKPEAVIEEALGALVSRLCELLIQAVNEYAAFAKECADIQFTNQYADHDAISVNIVGSSERKEFMLSESITLIAHSLHVLAQSVETAVEKLIDEAGRNQSLIDAMRDLHRRDRSLVVAARCAGELMRVCRLDESANPEQFAQR